MDWDEAKAWTLRIVVIALVIFAVIFGIGQLVGWYQTFKVYSAEQEGKAELQKAEFTRQISSLDAQAKVNIAVGEAQAEVERAKGAAEANRILADSLEGKTDYLRYLYIQSLATGNNREVIYIPTDGLLPVTEAGRAVETVPVEDR
jgi:hypothetical protein